MLIQIFRQGNLADRMQTPAGRQCAPASTEFNAIGVKRAAATRADGARPEPGKGAWP